MIENLTTTSFSSVTASLGAIAVFSTIRSLTSKSNKQKLSNATAALINVIAFIHYFRMRSIWDKNNKDVTAIRYSDWFVTCPLLLFEFFILMKWINIDEETNKLTMENNMIFPIVLSILTTIGMLICGYLSEQNPKYKWYLFGLGFVCLLILYVVLITKEFKNQKEDSEYNNIPKFPWIFIGIWTLYGLAYLSKKRDLFYNILDLIAKGLFAFIIGIN